MIIFRVHRTVGKNGCGAAETRRILAFITIPRLAPHEPVTHMKRREGFASPPSPVSRRSANFQQISHEKAGGPCGAQGPPRADPGGRFLAPGFLRPHRSSPVSKSGLVSCLRMLVLPLKCFLNLQKFLGFLFWGFSLLLVLVIVGLLFFFFPGRGLRAA